MVNRFAGFAPDCQRNAQVIMGIHRIYFVFHRYGM
jgi:hypothetical protein